EYLAKAYSGNNPMTAGVRMQTASHLTDQNASLSAAAMHSPKSSRSSASAIESLCWQLSNSRLWRGLPCQPGPTAASGRAVLQASPASQLRGIRQPEGKQVFREALEAGFMEGYFSLASQYRTQDDPSFCGLATLVMCLNSLEVDPGKVWKGPWRWFHEEMLDCCVQVDRVRKHGLTLTEFACLAGCNSLQVRRLVHPAFDADPQADAAGLAEFEATVRDCSRTDGCILVASYSRRALGQTGDGHFAPIGGFHPDRQLVLIFDTARFKYPSHWVPLRQLWDALKLPDSATGRPRGYCVLAKAPGLTAFRVSQRFATGVRQPDSPLLRLARDFEDWLAAEVEVGAPANQIREMSEAIAALSQAAGQLGRLCGRHRLAEAVLSRQRQAAADADAEAVLAALRSLPALGPVGDAFLAGLRQSAAAAGVAADVQLEGDNGCGGADGSLALLTLLAWPMPPGSARAALLAEARDWVLRCAPNRLATEVQLLRNQLSTIFEIAPVRVS
ncbi:hypothetical protein BOX15_Mlig000949g1, partial [Macrostomum lignano]